MGNEQYSDIRRRCTLPIPYVFKFFTPDTTTFLSVGSTNCASSKLFSGRILLDYSELQCSVLSPISSINTLNGSLTFRVAFQAGFGSHQKDLDASGIFTAGTNTITWKGGQNLIRNRVTFNAGRLHSLSPVDASRLKSFTVSFQTLVVGSN